MSHLHIRNGLLKVVVYDLSQGKNVPIPSIVVSFSGTVPKTHLHDRLRSWPGQVKRGRVKLTWTQNLPSYLYDTVIQAGFFSNV
jgi:hypothetical protein